jgi:hypothetical protein
MATVWAWRTDTGDWSKNNPDQTGWSHQLQFSDLKDLLGNAPNVVASPAPVQ